MILKKIFYFLYPINILKNFLQYTIGAILFFIFYNQISFVKFFFGLLSFILSYSFVYGLNDIIDYDNDKKDKKIRMKKRYGFKSPLMLNITSKEELFCFSSFVLILGILLSFFVNFIYSLLIFVLIFLNIIHSNPFINVKKFQLILIPNLFLIEFIKFSMGWFTQSSQFNLFPSWLITVFSGIYVFVYVAIRSHSNFNKNSFNKKISIMILAIFLSIAYLFSYFLYDIILPLFITTIILLILIISCVNLSKKFEFKKKILVGFLMTYVSIFIVVVSMLLIKFNPFLWRVNQEISENITHNPQIKQFILLLNQSNYELIPLNNTFVNITLDDICKYYVSK